MEEHGLLALFLGTEEVSHMLGIEESKVLQSMRNTEFFDKLRNLLLMGVEHIGIQRVSQTFTIEESVLESLSNLFPDSPNSQTISESLLFSGGIEESIEFEIETWYLEEPKRMISNVSQLFTKEKSKNLGKYTRSQKAIIVAEALKGGPNSFVTIGNKYNVDSVYIRKWLLDFQTSGEFTDSVYFKKRKAPILEQAIEELRSEF